MTKKLFLIATLMFATSVVLAQGSFLSSFLSGFNTALQRGLSQNNSNVRNQSQGMAIDQTGFAPGYQAPDIYDMAIDNTGVVSRRTNFGKRINYSDGYFQGTVVNGRRSAGTIYYNDGRIESCYEFDSDGKFNHMAAQEWPDGSWTVGRWNHGFKDGKFSKAVASNGYLTYYDEVWSSGTCISSVEVSSPSQNISSWNDNSNQYIDSGYSGSGSSSGNSSSSSSSCWRCKGSGNCSLCGGSGTISGGMSGVGYGYVKTHKCSNCNGSGKCTVCHGRGR